MVVMSVSGALALTAAVQVGRLAALIGGDVSGPGVGGGVVEPPPPQAANVASRAAQATRRAENANCKNLVVMNSP
jgi:hypothetical protein